LPGGNGARNYGFELSKGEFIQWFDDDDVINKTQYFNYTNDRINKYYQFNKLPITFFNYITQKINWLTSDVCIKVSVAKSICFNENLQSGQKYYYFCKLVHESIIDKFINKVVSLRRHHEKSIQSNLNHKHKKQISRFNRSWYTYLDLKRIATRNELEFLMNNCIKTCYDAKAIPFF
uniref:glycosyltransferase family A protein n=1 Tax=Xanthomarina gelatinilytica TaxID=1137281 RepID=UPI003AA7DECA